MGFYFLRRNFWERFGGIEYESESEKERERKKKGWEPEEFRESRYLDELRERFNGEYSERQEREWENNWGRDERQESREQESKKQKKKRERQH